MPLPRTALSRTAIRAVLFTGLCCAAMMAGPGFATATPISYRLDSEGSIVGFEADFGKTLIKGNMPVQSAEIVLDLDRVAASRVDVTLDAARSRTNIPFATTAMIGNSVLDTAQYPDIRFTSTTVRASQTGATVTGLLTIRGITQQTTLEATLYRPPGSKSGDRDRLSILLTGTVSRAIFGADGFADMVGDEIRLKILARIHVIN